MLQSVYDETDDPAVEYEILCHSNVDEELLIAVVDDRDTTFESLDAVIRSRRLFKSDDLLDAIDRAADRTCREHGKIRRGLACAQRHAQEALRAKLND